MTHPNRDLKSETRDATPGLRKRKRRQAVPAPATISLRQDLKPNEYHPLSRVNEGLRDKQRQQVFATILARIAAGPSMLAKVPDSQDAGDTADDGVAKRAEEIGP